MVVIKIRSLPKYLRIFPAGVAQTINSYIFRIHYKQIPMSIVYKIWQEKLPKI